MTSTKRPLLAALLALSLMTGTVGARATLQFASAAAGASLAASSAAVLVTAVSTGWLISAAGQAIAFVPSQIGASLLYNERVTR